MEFVAKALARERLSVRKVTRCIAEETVPPLPQEEEPPPQHEMVLAPARLES